MLSSRSAKRALTIGVALAALAAATPAYAHDPGVGIVRYNPDGSLDLSFGKGGMVTERTPQGGLDPEGMAVQPDGKILLAGTVSDLASARVGFGLARYNPDGTLDQTFGAGGRVFMPVGQGEGDAHALALLPDGRILVAGSAFPPKGGESQFALVRFTSDGALDTSFGAQGAVLTHVDDSGAEARAIGLEPDGRIVLAGTAFATTAHDDAFAVARYASDGELDRSFGTNGIAETDFESDGPSRASAVLVQADGTLVVAGSTGGHDGSVALARVSPDGTSMLATTRLQGPTQAFAVSAQPERGTLVAGGVGAADAQAFFLVRYGADGAQDPTFGSHGSTTTSFDKGGSGAHSVAVQSDGKIIVVGAGNGDFAIARYDAEGHPDPTFGDGGSRTTRVSDAGSFPAAVAIQADGKILSAGLTYFYVPPPGPLGLPQDQFLILVVAVVVAVLVGAVAAGMYIERKRAHRA